MRYMVGYRKGGGSRGSESPGRAPQERWDGPSQEGGLEFGLVIEAGRAEQSMGTGLTQEQAWLVEWRVGGQQARGTQKQVRGLGMPAS